MKLVAEMTDIELRTAVALAIGWRNVREQHVGKRFGLLAYPPAPYGGIAEFQHRVPEWTTSIADALSLEVLVRERMGLHSAYDCVLAKVALNDPTPRQRTEAALAALAGTIDRR